MTSPFVEQISDKVGRNAGLNVDEMRLWHNWFLATSGQLASLFNTSGGNINTLSSVTPSAGTLWDGEFVAVDQGFTTLTPTDPDFSGGFLSALGYTWNNINYKFGLVKTGAPGVGLSTDIAQFGSNISNPDTTALSIFHVAQSYNSESINAGATLFGSNSPGWANFLIDPVSKRINIRGGLTAQAYIDVDGTIGFGGGGGRLGRTGMNLEIGDAIFFGGYGMIGSSEVGATPTPVLNLENYDQSSANTLTNGGFETGDLTGWTTVAGSPLVISSDFYEGAFCLELDNADEITQTVTGFAGKHPVVYFWHKGPQIALVLDMLDAGSATILSFARNFPQTDTWLRYSAGFYNNFETVTQIKVRLTGNGTDCLIDSVNLLKLDDYARLSIGDAYGISKDIVRVAARKLMVGNGSASDNTAMLDVRGNIQAYNVNSSGWMEVKDTWTYASASTFTIPTNGTLIYQKGDKLRWSEDGGATYKYGALAAIAATLATIIINTDHVITNTAISDVAYSRIDKPLGWPEWFNYAPVPTGYSVLPTNTVYQYRTEGTTCWWHIRENTNGTSNLTTLTIPLPVAAATLANDAFFFAARVMNNGAGFAATPGLASVSSGGTVISFFLDYAATAFANVNGKRVAGSDGWYKF